MHRNSWLTEHPDYSPPKFSFFSMVFIYTDYFLLLNQRWSSCQVFGSSLRSRRRGAGWWGWWRLGRAYSRPQGGCRLRGRCMQATPGGRSWGWSRRPWGAQTWWAPDWRLPRQAAAAGGLSASWKTFCRRSVCSTTTGPALASGLLSCPSLTTHTRWDGSSSSTKIGLTHCHLPCHSQS